jgi:hypothetical protein
MTGLRSRLRRSAVRGGGARGLHQRAKQRSCQGVALHSLWMPLNADHPVFVRLVLDGFDHTIGGDSGEA